jgi:hypothetical protein
VRLSHTKPAWRRIPDTGRLLSATRQVIVRRARWSAHCSPFRATLSPSRPNSALSGSPVSRRRTFRHHVSVFCQRARRLQHVNCGCSIVIGCDFGSAISTSLSIVNKHLTLGPLRLRSSIGGSQRWRKTLDATGASGLARLSINTAGQRRCHHTQTRASEKAKVTNQIAPLTPVHRFHTTSSPIPEK